MLHVFCLFVGSSKDTVVKSFVARISNTHFGFGCFPTVW